MQLFQDDKLIKDDLSLSQAIVALEQQQKSDMSLLKEHFDFTVDSLNPKNLIKEKFQDLTSSPTFKSRMLKYGVGLVTGFITKKAITGKNPGIFKSVLGIAAQTVISGIIMKAPILKNTQHNTRFLQK